MPDEDLSQASGHGPPVRQAGRGGRPRPGPAGQAGETEDRPDQQAHPVDDQRGAAVVLEDEVLDAALEVLEGQAADLLAAGAPELFRGRFGGETHAPATPPGAAAEVGLLAVEPEPLVEAAKGLEN